MNWCHEYIGTQTNSMALEVDSKLSLAAFLIRIVGSSRCGRFVILCLLVQTSHDIATHTVSGNLQLILGYIVITLCLVMLFNLLALWVNEYVKVKLIIRLQNSLVYSQMMLVWST